MTDIEDRERISPLLKRLKKFYRGNDYWCELTSPTEILKNCTLHEANIQH